MKFHVLQHVPFEDEGAIRQWADSRNIPISRTRLFEQEKLPAIQDFDLLIVMGGPMGIYDYEDYPWLTQEKEFLKKAIEAEKIIFGICLGAQLLSDVLGSNVEKNTCKEIGWFDVNLLNNIPSTSLMSGLPTTFKALHWHGDKFNIPKKGNLLANSEGCTHQAFEYAERILGLQFHIEITPSGLKRLIDHCRDELSEGGPYIEAEEDMLRVAEEYSMKSLLDRIMDNLTEKIQKSYRST